MSRSPKLVVLLLLALMSLAAVPSAAVTASEERDSRVRIIREPVTWTLSPDQCSDIHLSIQGTGQRLEVITTTEKSNDSKEIITNDFVSGTAVDTQGNTYRFVYANQNTQLVRGRKSPIKVNVTDTFVLSGNNGANNLNVGFIWSWTFTPPEPFFPPAHNWVQVYTLGDPLNCDPI